MPTGKLERPYEPYPLRPEACDRARLPESFQREIERERKVWAEGDDELFEDKMQQLVAQWREQQAQATKLDATIAVNLKELGYGN